MAAVTICSDFGAPRNKVSHRFHYFPIYFPWSDGTGCHDLSFYLSLILVSECWVLNQLFHSPLSPSLRGFFVLVHFLPQGWYNLHIWGYWYFSWQSWFQLVLQPRIRLRYLAVKCLPRKIILLTMPNGLCSTFRGQKQGSKSKIENRPFKVLPLIMILELWYTVS